MFLDALSQMRARARAQATVSSVCTQLDLQDGKKTKNQEVSAAATEVSPSVLSRTQSEEQTLQSGLKTRRQTDLLEKGLC